MLCNKHFNITRPLKGALLSAASLLPEKHRKREASSLSSVVAKMALSYTRVGADEVPASAGTELLSCTLIQQREIFPPTLLRG